MLTAVLSRTGVLVYNSVSGSVQRCEQAWKGAAGAVGSSCFVIAVMMTLPINQTLAAEMLGAFQRPAYYEWCRGSWREVDDPNAADWEVHILGPAGGLIEKHPVMLSSWLGPRRSHPPSQGTYT